jgi:D-serine deaminase-like pyridoxal phosphate-dependent protein
MVTVLSYIYAVQVYGKEIFEEVKDVSRLESETMVATAKRFKDLGIHLEVVSLGATPTMWGWGGCTGIYEIRTGNYKTNNVLNKNLFMHLGGIYEQRAKSLV